MLFLIIFSWNLIFGILKNHLFRLSVLFFILEEKQFKKASHLYSLVVGAVFPPPVDDKSDWKIFTLDLIPITRIPHGTIAIRWYWFTGSNRNTLYRNTKCRKKCIYTLHQTVFPLGLFFILPETIEYSQLKRVYVKIYFCITKMVLEKKIELYLNLT